MGKGKAAVYWLAQLARCFEDAADQKADEYTDSLSTGQHRTKRDISTLCLGEVDGGGRYFPDTGGFINMEEHYSGLCSKVFLYWLMRL